MNDDFRSINLQETTETLLEDGLRERGHDVRTYGHHDEVDLSRVDLVHIHHLARGCLPFLRRRQVPLVFTRHATKRLPLRQHLVLQATYQRANAIVALSDYELGSLPPKLSPKAVRIYNGVRESDFPLTGSRRAPAHQDSWNILVVGQLVELKRTYLALDAVSVARRLGVNARLRVVHQRDTLLPELRRLRTELGLDEFVEFCGPMTRAELSRELAASHLLVHPSRTEALPTVLTEAMFTGLPVLAFMVGGIAEQVPDPHRLLHVDDVASFGTSVVSSLNDYSALAARYRSWSGIARRRFSVEEMVEKHETLYANVLGSGS
jgi:glycosyltransferase involved in cell wall biosynthesis